MDWTRRYRNPNDEPVETPVTPDEAVRYLLDGNARFVSVTAPGVSPPSTILPTDPAAYASLSATPVPQQRPFSVILGCSDARVPAELVFGVRPNQLFVVRVAGNVLADECLGSIEYALHTFKDSVHLLTVLGHSGCGAVTAAVDAYLDPTRHNSIAFTRSLRSVVNHVFISVRAAALALEEFWGPTVTADPGYRAALVEVSVYLNAAMTAYQLQQELRPEEAFQTRVVYGVFDVANCHVIGPDLNPFTDDTSKLAPALTAPEQLAELGRQIAASPMAAQHLTPSLRLARHPAGGPRPGTAV